MKELRPGKILTFLGIAVFFYLGTIHSVRADEKNETKASDNLEASLGNLKGSAKAIRNENKELKDQNKQLSSEIADLKKQIENLSAAYEKGNKKLSQKNKDILLPAMTSGASLDKESLKRLKEEKSDWLKKISELNDEEQKTLANMDLLNQFIADLESKIASVKNSDPSAVEDQNKVLMLLMKEIQKVKNDIQKEKLAQETLSRQETKESKAENPALTKNQQLSDSLVQERESLKSLSSQEEIFLQERKELEDKRNTELSQLNEKITLLKTEHQDLTNFVTLMDRKFKPDEMDISALSTEETDLSTNIILLRDENRFLKSKLLKLMEKKIDLEHKKL